MHLALAEFLKVKKKKDFFDLAARSRLRTATTTRRSGIRATMLIDTSVLIALFKDRTGEVTRGLRDLLDGECIS